MMVQSPRTNSCSFFYPTDTGLPIAQEIVAIERPWPCPSSFFNPVRKKLRLHDSIALCDEFNFKFTCGKSSEERGGGAGGGSPSRRSGKGELDEAAGDEGEGGGGGGGGGGSGVVSSSPSQEEEEEQQQQLRGAGGVERRRNRGGRRGVATSETRHPVYRGVRKRQGDRWVSEIREPGKKSRIWLGTFPTPEMAARAYDTAAFNLKRPYAYLNFPDSASSLPLLPLSSTPKHIQEAAAAAAAAFAAITIPPGGGAGGHVQTFRHEQQDPEAAAPEGEPSTPISPQTAFSYFDEDIIFDMPNVLTDMAEGLMITPPLLNHGNLNGSNGDNDVAEPSLWND